MGVPSRGRGRANGVARDRMEFVMSSCVWPVLRVASGQGEPSGGGLLMRQSAPWRGTRPRTGAFPLRGVNASCKVGRMTDVYTDD